MVCAPPGSTQGGPRGLCQARHQPGPHSSPWPPPGIISEPQEPGDRRCSPCALGGRQGGNGDTWPPARSAPARPGNTFILSVGRKSSQLGYFYTPLPPGDGPTSLAAPPAPLQAPPPPGLILAPIPFPGPVPGPVPILVAPPTPGLTWKPPEQRTRPGSHSGTPTKLGEGPSPQPAPPTPRTVGPCGMGSDARGGN